MKGIIHAEKQDYELALQCLNEALAMFQDLQAVKEVAATEKNISRVQQKLTQQTQSCDEAPDPPLV